MQHLLKFQNCDVYVSDAAWADMTRKKESLPIYKTKSPKELLNLVHDLDTTKVQKALILGQTFVTQGAMAIRQHLKSMKAFDKAAQARFAATGQWPTSALNSLPTDGLNATLTVNQIFDFSPVGQGLQKYFHLGFSDPAYLERVQKVGAVLEKMVGRFKTGFKLELLTAAEVKGWNGRAFPSKLSDRDGILDFFGDPQKQYHEPRKYVSEYEKMQLPIDYVAFCPREDVARTIAHEMSHIAALTQDVLYKHESFSKNEDDRNMSDGKMIPLGIAVPGRTKPMQPLSGVQRDRRGIGRTSDLVDSATYVHNADSYAWFSRRMLKVMNPETYKLMKGA